MECGPELDGLDTSWPARPTRDASIIGDGYGQRHGNRRAAADISKLARPAPRVAQLGQPFASAPALPNSLPAVWLAVATAPAAVLPAPAVSRAPAPGRVYHHGG